jgi:predicted alpha/beta-hydrolase family hydrolase
MPTPLFVFAPGAGAPASHPWMQAWKARFAQLGAVKTFDYPYMREGRKRPDRLPELIAAHSRALAEAKKEFGSERPVFLVGKSMGGRIGCHLALEEKVSGLICLGYPLCAMGDRSKMRDQVLCSLGTAILFVQGTRDPLCPLELLEKVRARMTASNFLEIVEGGDHSLGVRKRDLQARGQTQEQVDRQILEAIATFVRSIV